MTVGMIAGVVVAAIGLLLIALGVRELVYGVEADLADLLVGGFMLVSGAVIFTETAKSAGRW
jgi:hypothetical protein